MEKLDADKLKRAAEKLKALLPKVRNADRVASDERLFSRFRPVFSPQNLPKLSEKDFRDFTLYSENEHWTGIHRHNGKILAEIETLRKVLLEVVDETKPIEQRIDQFRPRGKGKLINGLGSSIYTAILFVLNPEKYPVLNTKTRRSLRALGIYPVKSSDSHGVRYKKVIEVSHSLATALGCSLAELDGLHHHFLESRGNGELPALFKLSPGRQGESWEEQRNRRVAAIGWIGSGDLSKETDLQAAARRSSEKNEGGNIPYIAQQFEILRDEMEEGDLVLYYAKGTILGVGVVAGEYTFVAANEQGHTRPVTLLEPFAPVDITGNESLKDFFYDNNTLRSVDDDELADAILKAIRHINPKFDWRNSTVSEVSATRQPTARQFQGFEAAAFELLKRYEASPVKATYQASKSDFKRLLKTPTRALMADAAPIVDRIMGDDIETESWITSVIHKNDYGKGGIHSHFWAAFYPTGKKRISSPQMFVIIYTDSLRFGFGFGLYSKEYEERFKQNYKGSTIWNPAYLAQLKALGIALRVYKPNEKKDIYDGPIDETILSKALEESEEQPNFDVKLTPTEVEGLGPGLVDRVQEVFNALLPLYILATCDSPAFFMKKWDSTLSFGGEELEDETPLTETKYIWSEFLTDLNWSDSSPEAQHITAVLGNSSSNGVYEGRQFIFYGPPGTGKTRAAMKLATHLATSRKGHIKVVQFHQSYGYEQFIEGIKPKTVGGQLSYETREGVFVEFCRNAELRPNEQFVFVIDEINRGNVSRIFGELMYLLEYREQKLPLLYSQTPFSIPKNVIIIGTMNSADRSIALVDYALRRRFNFIEVKPQSGVLRRIYRASENEEHERSIRFLEKLNTKIRDSRLFIGHSYFLTEECQSKGLTKVVVRKIWDTALFPLLQEYYLAAPNRLEDFDFERIWTEAGEGDSGETSRAA